MNHLPFFLARILRDLRTIRIIPAGEKCPRCIWKYDTGQKVCQYCRRITKTAHMSNSISEEPERCENCGNIVPPEHQMIGIEHQGEQERSGSVYYFAGYDCPACGHHAEV